MRIKVPKVARRGAMATITHQVLDLHTGNPIGYLEIRRQPNAPSLYISLFGGNYVGGFGSFGECNAFAQGVESVLNHMGSIREEKPEQAGQRAICA